MPFNWFCTIKAAMSAGVICIIFESIHSFQSFPIMLCCETEWTAVFIATNQGCYGGTPGGVDLPEVEDVYPGFSSTARKKSSSSTKITQTGCPEYSPTIHTCTCRTRGVSWVRASSITAIPHTNRRYSYHISLSNLLSQRPAWCETSERPKRMTTLW